MTRGRTTGFSRQASEVRSLAHRSKIAAEEIRELIEVSTERVAQGTQHASEVEATMVNITKANQQVAQIINNMARAVGEQRDSIAQTSTSLGQIEHASQRHTAMAEETAAATRELSLQAENLMSEVSRFQL